MNLDRFRGPALAEINRHIDILDGAEPYRSHAAWRPSFDALHDELRRTREIRRYLTIPAVLVAAALVVVFRGEVWDWNDARNFFGIGFTLLWALRIAMTKVFAALDREDRVQTLLRYFGAKDVPDEDEIPV